MNQKNALECAISQIDPNATMKYFDRGIEWETTGERVINILSAMVEAKNKQAEKAEENRKPSKKRIENDELAQRIEAYLREAGAPKTAQDMEILKNKIVGVIGARKQFVRAFDGRKIIGWTVKD